MRWYCVQL